MPTVFITDANSILAPSGDGYSVGGGTTLSVMEDGHVLAQEGTAVRLTLTGALVVHGEVWGDDFGAIADGSTANAVSSILVGPTGILGGATGAIGTLYAAGFASLLEVRNLGYIGVGAPEFGILSYAAISAIEFREVAIINAGTIEAAGRTAVSVFGTDKFFLANTGEMLGNVRWEITTAPDGVAGYVTVQNSGLISGSVLVRNNSSGVMSLRVEHSGTILGDMRIQGAVSGAVAPAEVNVIGGEIGGELEISTSSNPIYLRLDAASIGQGFTAFFNSPSSAVIVGSASGATIGVRFLTGSGDDRVNLTGAAIGGDVGLSGGNDELVMNAGTVLGGVNLGGGNDTANLSGALVGGDIDLGAGDDTFTGGGNAERVAAGGGNDSVDLGAGNDTLLIGFPGSTADGNDTLDGGAGIDLIDLSRVTAGAGGAEGTAGVLVRLAEGLVRGLPGNAANLYGIDEVFGFENVTGTSLSDEIFGDGLANRLRGGAGLDILAGNKGDDTLRAGDGDDLVIGGAGRDVLDGGAGADTFEFRRNADSKATEGKRDIIMDYQTGVDAISMFLMDAQTRVEGQQSFTFAGNAPISAVGTVRYLQVEGNTIVEANTAGNNLAEFAVVLRGLHVLTAADFVF